jgi:hypothetical protein
MDNISKHISYAEATISQTATRKGIFNTPDSEQLANMKLVAEKCFEPVRVHFKTPLRISSFFRSEKLNKAVGGLKTSQHKNGQAIDVQGTGKVSNAMIFNFIKDNLEFDQLIWEFGTDQNPAWVHVSYSKTKNRKQIIYIK